MDVTIHIPDAIAPLLIEGGGDIARTALESVALEALRAGRITDVQLRHMLGLARIEMDGFLNTLEDLNRNGRPSKTSGSKLCGWISADTGPVKYLIQIGEIDLLPRMFEKIALPLAVQAELADPLAPLPVRRWIVTHPMA